MHHIRFHAAKKICAFGCVAPVGVAVVVNVGVGVAVCRGCGRNGFWSGSEGWEAGPLAEATTWHKLT